jgi:hypothetical protein
LTALLGSVTKKFAMALLSSGMRLRAMIRPVDIGIRAVRARKMFVFRVRFFDILFMVFIMRFLIFLCKGFFEIWAIFHLRNHLTLGLKEAKMGLTN